MTKRVKKCWVCGYVPMKDKLDDCPNCGHRYVGILIDWHKKEGVEQ